MGKIRRKCTNCNSERLKEKKKTCSLLCLDCGTDIPVIEYIVPARPREIKVVETLEERVKKKFDGATQTGKIELTEREQRWLRQNSPGLFHYLTPTKNEVTKDDMLKSLFSHQKELMQIVEKHSGDTGTVSANILAAIVELGELANEEGSFKWWKNQDKNQDKDKILDELVDVLFFWLQICIKLKFEPEDIIKGYLRKWEVNIDRQKSNY